MWRNVTAVTLLVAIALALAGCVQVRNMVADRDLVCRETPDDVCIRVADLGLSRMDVVEQERELGPIPTIQVYPVGCTADEFGVAVPTAKRCWMVEATNEGGGIGIGVFESPDGSLHAGGE